MRWVDSQGRLFGRISVVDLMLALFLAALSPIVVYACRLSQPLAPRVIEIRPKQIPSGGILRVQGVNFTAQSQVRLGSSPASGVEFYGSDLLVVYLPRDLPPGPYVLSVQNPNGRVGHSEMEVEVLRAVPRARIPVVLTVVFEGLDPETANRLEQNAGPREETSDPAPRLLRVLKKGPMYEIPEKESLLADVLLLGEVEWWEGEGHYYYQGQPLHPNYAIPLEIGGETWNGIIRRGPNPTRLDKG